MKIFPGLEFKNERLPAKTAINAKAVRPSRPIKLIDSSLSLRANPKITEFLQAGGLDVAKARGASTARLAAAVDSVNAQIEGSAQFKNIRFGVHEASGRNFAVVRDRKTGEVLRQIPGDAFLEIAARLKEASGLLVDVVG